MITKKLRKKLLLIKKKFQPFTLTVKKRLGKRGLIVLLVLLSGLIIWRVITATRPDWIIEVTQVKKGQLLESITAPGEVAAEEVANLTFQTSGKLIWVGVKKGDKVSKWQGIASLDKKQLELRLGKYLNTWEREFSEFYDTGDSVKDEVLTDAVRRIKERAQIDLDQTQIDVEIENIVIELATITAPFSGIVTQANPSYPGVNVTPASAIYTIVNPETVYFEAEVNEVDVVRLKVGQVVKLKLYAFPDEELESEIINIDFASTITSTGGTAYKIKMGLPNKSDMVFRLGMNGDAEFILQITEDVLLSPLTAIIEEDDKTFVWVIDEKGVAKKVEVETGISSTDEIEIISGIKEGELVISKPPTKMEEGDKIAVTGGEV